MRSLQEIRDMLENDPAQLLAEMALEESQDGSMTVARAQASASIALSLREIAKTLSKIEQHCRYIGATGAE